MDESAILLESRIFEKMIGVLDFSLFVKMQSV